MITIFILVAFVSFFFFLKLRKENKEHKRELKEMANNNQSALREVKRIKYDSPSGVCRGFNLMGLRYRSTEAQNDALKLVIGEKVLLEQEPYNPKDNKAIRVVTLRGFHIGYVESDFNEFVYDNFDNVIEARVSNFPNEGCPYYSIHIFFTNNTVLPL